MVTAIYPRSVWHTNPTEPSSKVKVKCSKLFNNQLYLGLSNGYMSIYQLADSNEPSNEQCNTQLDNEIDTLGQSRKFDSFGRLQSKYPPVSITNMTNNESKGIQSIEIIPILKLLIILTSNGEVNYFNMQTLDAYTAMDPSVPSNLPIGAMQKLNNVSLIKCLSDTSTHRNSHDSSKSLTSPDLKTNGDDTILNTLNSLNVEEEDEWDEEYCEPTQFDDSISLATSTNQHHHYHHNNLNSDDISTKRRAEKSEKSYLVIVSKRKVTIYKWLKQEFQSELEYNLTYKLKTIEFLSNQRLLIALNSNEFYSIDLLNNEPNLSLTKLNLPFPSSHNSFFSFNDHTSIFFLDLNFCFLATRDQSAWKLDNFADLVSYNSSNFSSIPQNVGMVTSSTSQHNNQSAGAASLTNESFHNRSHRSYHPNSTKVNPLNFDKIPRFLKFWFPYLILVPNGSNSIEVRSTDTGNILQVIEDVPNLDTLIDIHMNQNSLLLVTQTTTYQFSKRKYTLMLDSLKKAKRYDEAIDLIGKLSPLVFDNTQDSKSGEIPPRQLKFLKLRDFQLLKAQDLLHNDKHSKKDIKMAMHLFVEFMGSPDFVIQNLPLPIRQLLSDTKIQNQEADIPVPKTKGATNGHSKFGKGSSNGSSNESSLGTDTSKVLNKKTSRSTLSSPISSVNGTNDGISAAFTKEFINNLMPYLTDCRRKLARLLDPGSPKFQWKGITISSDLYVSPEKFISAHDDQDESFNEAHTHNISEKLMKLSELVDTTLFRCYILTSPKMVGPLLRVANNCRPEEIEKQLTSLNMFKELIDFYYSKNLHQKALDLLRYLSDSSTESNDLEFRGCTTTVRYLQRLNNSYLDIILQYSKWPIEQDLTNGINIFINDSIECESLDRFKVLDFLVQYKDQGYKLPMTFLENLVYELNEQVSVLHNKLLELYFHRLDDQDTHSAQKEETFDKVKQLYMRSSTYDAKFALRQIDQYLNTIQKSKSEERESVTKKFLLLKIEPLCKLNQHVQVLDILIDGLDDHQKALEFCSSIYEEDELKGGKLLKYLLNRYLDSSTENLQYALKLLKQQASRFDIMEVLKVLPSDLPVSEIISFLNLQLSGVENRVQDTRMESSLLKVNILKCKERLLNIRNESVVIPGGRTCPVCNKRLGNSVLNVYPDGTVLHYGCSTSVK